MEDKLKAGFSIAAYNSFQEVPLTELDNLTYSAYIIDYNWTYLFVNAIARQVFGSFADQLIGKSALQVFSDPKFAPIFEELKYGVENKITVEAVIYSPMRNANVNIKGYPLDDCYYFSVTTLPGRDEVFEDLRKELNKRK